MRKSETFVTVDALIFKQIETINYLLLVQRKNDPYKNFWALPGGFVDTNEDIDIAVKRELFEETRVRVGRLEQLKAFGKPFRDPRHHVITIAYYGFVDENTRAVANDDAKAVRWFAIHALPDLAFDHEEIIKYALTTIKL